MLFFKVHKNIPNRELRRLYSTYRGTGTIYGIVVSFFDGNSAYVPISTYACDVSEGLDSCLIPSTISNIT